MDTPSQAVTTQAQAMTTQANREVAPHVNQNASTTDSRLRDFTRMNHPMLFGSNVNEDPQDFLDEVYKMMKGFIDRLFESEKQEAKVEEFINLRQGVEENMIKNRNSDAKRAIPYDGGTCKGKFEIQDKPKINKTFSNKVHSNFSRSKKDRVTNSKPKWRKISGSQSEKPNCANKRHMGKCLKGADNCIGCGKSGHMVKIFPMENNQGRESNQS
ncbi:hypothetical protein EJD97_023520 [Solanum chilense]|uniref:CCHC-type domain-containing protein n=1 Tax=Solanum chilense TaxID=4083 RepID=A0A6N2C2J3_SOLCI|nr:hypothetical protein EJD97_023520 [Solanum chilense]